MKRSKLSMGLALATAMGGLVGGAYAPSASAVNISAQNLGDVLIFPYYTARCSDKECWQTLLNLTNVSDKSLAVKLIFYEGYNSREVLDFTVVMSKKDVFAGYVTAGVGYVPPVGNAVPTSDVSARFVKASDDTTCTVPTIPAAGLNFSNVRYSGPNTDHASENDIYKPVPGSLPYLTGGLSLKDRGYEGYIVAIVMGHKGTEPGDCTAVSKSFEKPQFISAKNPKWPAPNEPEWLPAPTPSAWGEPLNALKGNYNFLNVERGVSAGGIATHLANFVSVSGYHPELGSKQNPVDKRDCFAIPSLGVGLPSTTTMFFNPIAGARNPAWDPGVNATHCPNLLTAQSSQPGFDSLEPTLADAYPNRSYTVNDDRGLGAATTFGPYGYGYLAVSEVLRATNVINEWSFNTDLGVSTEWVITHPTKNFFVDPGPSPLAANNARRFPATFDPDWQEREDQIPIPPFQEAFSSVTDGQSCNQVGIDAYDRNEKAYSFNDIGVVQSPVPRDAKQSLCFETNVISFQDPADKSYNGPIFESRLTLNLSEGITSAKFNRPLGWLNMDVAKPDVAKSGALSEKTGAINQLRGNGLPVVGFMIKQRKLNIGPTDLLKNYAYASDHAFKGRGIPCSKTTTPTCPLP